MSKTIAILTSGGDSPGMNAAVRAATMVAVAKGHRMLGVRNGYRGLLDRKIAPIGADDVNGILREGGTILHSARSRRFLEVESRDHARDVLTERGVDGLIVIGGNGSLTGLELLSNPAEANDWPVQCIGIPASIDNDIALTGLAIGVDTAMNTIVEACDRIADTAGAHGRTFIIVRARGHRNPRDRSRTRGAGRPPERVRPVARQSFRQRGGALGSSRGTSENGFLAASHGSTRRCGRPFRRRSVLLPHRPAHGLGSDQTPLGRPKPIGPLEDDRLR